MGQKKPPAQKIQSPRNLPRQAKRRRGVHKSHEGGIKERCVFCGRSVYVHKDTPPEVQIVCMRPRCREILGAQHRSVSVVQRMMDLLQMTLPKKKEPSEDPESGNST